MIVRGFETADGRTVEDGRFGGFPAVGDLRAERQLADVDLDPFEALDSAARAVVGVRARVELRVRELCEATGVPYTAIGPTGGDALHEATLPVEFER
jgi:hypothetical protein